MGTISGPISAAVWGTDHVGHPGKPRLKTVQLEWPLEYEGQSIEQVTLRRLTGGEVAGLQDAMMAEGATDAGMIAAFADQPEAVIAALDADDFYALKDAVVDFLPRRIRQALEAVLAEETAPAG